MLNAENTFKAVMLEWHEKRKHLWTEKHAAKLLRRFELCVFPVLGRFSINQITPPELLAFLRKIEAEGTHDKAHRLNQTIGQVLRYAIATGRAERDITADLRGALQPVKKRGHAYLKEEELPEFLKKLEQYDGDMQTRIGVKLLLLTYPSKPGSYWEFIRRTGRYSCILPVSSELRNPFRKSTSWFTNELF